MTDPAPITLTGSQVKQMSAYIEEQQAQDKSFRLQSAPSLGDGYLELIILDEDGLPTSQSGYSSQPRAAGIVRTIRYLDSRWRSWWASINVSGGGLRPAVRVLKIGPGDHLLLKAVTLITTTMSESTSVGLSASRSA